MIYLPSLGLSHVSDEDGKNQNDVWYLVWTLILNCFDGSGLSSMSASAHHVTELIQSPHQKVSFWSPREAS